MRSGIDYPNNRYARGEILVQFSLHLGFRIPLREHFHGKVGHKRRDRLLRKYALGKMSPTQECHIGSANLIAEDSQGPVSTEDDAQVVFFDKPS
jgi:hypothetical protein